MNDTLRELTETGWLADVDLRMGRALIRFGEGDEPDLELIGALLSRSVRDGHVCFTPAQLEPRLRGSVASVMQNLSSSVIGDGRRPTPLVLEEDRLYLHRSYEREVALASHLLDRAEVRHRLKPTLAESLDRLFGADATDPRRLAALRAVESRLLVITGGPGTGKTTTVVRLLAFLVEAARLDGAHPPRFSLLAPTGKASARLAESVRGAVAKLDVDPWTLGHLPNSAQTVHRALGLGEFGRARFNARHPWSADVVLVDEASMVDLELMHQILEATRRDARLLLLGDPDQLSSVEAGSVLADLALGRDRFVAQTLERLKVFRVEGFVANPSATPLDDSVVGLQGSHRYAVESGIGALARAILAGDGERVLEILAGTPGVTWKQSMRDGLLESILEGYGRVAEVDEPAERHRRLREHRVVCARRAGAYGVDDLNQRTRRALGASPHASFEGLPLFVRRNDLGIDLYNGDVGVVGGRSAWFEGPGGDVREVPIALVPPHNDAFAMTVHQSQGSEFRAVSVVLADESSHLASRELFYTAVTRARDAVTVYGRPADVVAAVERPAFRDSGLRQRLCGARR